MLALGVPWLLAAALAAGCAPEPAGLQVWACGDSVKVSPQGRWLDRGPAADTRSRNSVWDAAARTVRVAGARGETVAFQLQLEAAGRPQRGVDVRIAPPQRGGAALAAFELFRVFYTQVRVPSQSPGPSLGPGWYPDALVPFRIAGHGAPFDVEAGRSQGVWVDVAIAPDAPAGEHRGEIQVRSAAGPPLRLGLVLEVFDFAVPPIPSFRIHVATYELGKGGHAINSGWGGRFDVWGDAFRELERKFYRMARAHRHVLHPRNYELPVSAAAGGALAIDWRRFDRRWGALFDGSAWPDGIPIDYWEIALERNVPAASHGGRGSPRHRQAVAAYARAFAKHFREMGWNHTQLVAFPVDEPGDEGAVAEAHGLAEAVAEGAPEIRFRIDVYRGLSRPLIARLDPVVDIWAIQGSSFNGLLDELLRRRSRGREVWFYQGSAPALGAESLDAEGLALRTWAWIGWRYRLDAADLWECCKWQQSEDIWTQPLNHEGWQTNAPGVLYYPGARVGVDEPIPSLRLKALRRGAFDYEYLSRLARLGGRAEADRIAASIVRSALDQTRQASGEPGDWSHDPDRWEQARRELAGAIAAAQSRATGAPGGSAP